MYWVSQWTNGSQVCIALPTNFAVFSTLIPPCTDPLGSWVQATYLKAVKLKLWHLQLLRRWLLVFENWVGVILLIVRKQLTYFESLCVKTCCLCVTRKIVLRNCRRSNFREFAVMANDVEKDRLKWLIMIRLRCQVIIFLLIVFHYCKLHIT